MKQRHEKKQRRTLGKSKRLSGDRKTLDFRERQLRDEDKSCGNQPANIREIDRRINLLMSEIIAYKKSNLFASPTKVIEGFYGLANKFLIIKRRRVIVKDLTG